MNSKLYVGGLPYATTDEALKNAFSQAGTVVSATIIKDKFSGRSKGFGFVEMSSEEEANNAIGMFHGKDFEGRTLTVNIARPLEPRQNRPQYGGGGNRFGGNRSGGFGGGRRDNFSRGGHGGRGGNRSGGSGYDETGGRDW